MKSLALALFAASLLARLTSDAAETVTSRLSVFSPSSPVGEKLKQLDPVYLDALEVSEKPIQDFLASYRASLDRRLESARQAGDLDAVQLAEIAIRKWDAGEIPLGDGKMEMVFVMKSPEVFSESAKKLEMVVSRLTREDRVELAKELKARVVRIGEDFGAIPSSPLWNDKILTYTFRVDGEVLKRLGLASGGMAPQRPAREALEDHGVTFPQGTQAVLTTGELVVRNTRRNLYFVQDIIAKR